MTMQTRAAVCRAPGRPLTLETLELRDPLPDEVLVEIRASGLCHSDLHQMEGVNAPFPFPVVPGHEGAG
ncbi:MAG: alcohol dehydrogenase catalytic domain-containing protein, partial [Spongiibacteraceae bacterium]|nr:alcohol dehydrogenase catalytic domain-containing protein [Spongiibacteraceae bacterium]